VQHGTSTWSRRLSEIAGVLWFAAGLFWLIALATHAPTDPVIFVSTRTSGPVANLVGPVGAFLSEVSFQLVGYAAFLFPLVAVVIGWFSFWCKRIDAPYTKLLGVVLIFACAAAFLALALPSARTAGRAFDPGGWFGDQLAGALSASFNLTGSLILIMTLLFLSVILATQVSLGRMFRVTTSWVGGGVSQVVGAS
jgi:S-DNA-T family DNA segregation ATPase FtsK/SpoIIIE